MLCQDSPNESQRAVEVIPLLIAILRLLGKHLPQCIGFQDGHIHFQIPKLFYERGRQYRFSRGGQPGNPYSE